MIVYNVQRRFFDMKADAEEYRKACGLKPSATIKIEISDRRQLAELLDALCEPSIYPVAEANLPASDRCRLMPEELIDHAYVAPDFDVPRFLRESWAKHEQEGAR